MNPDTIQQAAEAILNSDGLLVCAGAGMGADSGLPTFRGDNGFWNAYPALRHLGIRFVEMADPRWFTDAPEMAWAFYGHRHQLYAATEPHAGFRILQRWADQMERSSFVFTSNVDGHFQKAGFPEERVHECHGSILHLQCLGSCRGIWPAGDLDLHIDFQSFRAEGMPICPDCRGMARPNILMFGDGEWESERSNVQQERLSNWLNSLTGLRLAIVEVGAGTAVPSVRYFSEGVANNPEVIMIRINKEAPEGPEGTISFQTGGLEALEAIDSKLAKP